MDSNPVVYWLFLVIGLAILIYEAHHQFDRLASKETDDSDSDLFSSLKPGDMRSRSAFRSAELCYVGVIVILYLLLCLSEAVQFVAATIIQLLDFTNLEGGGQAPALAGVDSGRSSVLKDPTVPFVTAVTMVTAMRFPLVRKLENILRSFTHSLFGIPSIPKRLSAKIEKTDIDLSAIEGDLSQYTSGIPASQQISVYVEAYKRADPAGAEYGLFKRNLRKLAAYRLWVQTGVWPTENFRVSFNEFSALNRELIEKIDTLFADCEYLQSTPHIQETKSVDEQLRLRRDLWQAKAKSASRYAKTTSSMFALFEQNSNPPAEGLPGSASVRKFLGGIRQIDVDRATQTNLTLLLILTAILVNALFGAMQAIQFRMIGPEIGLTVEQMNNSPSFNLAGSALTFAIGALITFGVSLWIAVATRRKAMAAGNWRFHHDPENHVPHITQALKLAGMLFSTVFSIQLIWLLSNLSDWSILEPRDQWWPALRIQAETAGLLSVAASLHGVMIVSIMDLARFDSARSKWLKIIGAYIACMALVGFLIGFLMPGEVAGQSVRMAIYTFDQAVVAAITGLWLFVYLRDREDSIQPSTMPTRLEVT